MSERPFSADSRSFDDPDGREALRERVRSLVNPWDREYDPVKQPWVGPSAVGFEEARTQVLAALDSQEREP